MVQTAGIPAVLAGRRRNRRTQSPRRHGGPPVGWQYAHTGLDARSGTGAARCRAGGAARVRAQYVGAAGAAQRRAVDIRSARPTRHKTSCNGTAGSAHRRAASARAVRPTRHKTSCNGTAGSAHRRAASARAARPTRHKTSCNGTAGSAHCRAVDARAARPTRHRATRGLPGLNGSSGRTARRNKTGPAQCEAAHRARAR